MISKKKISAVITGACIALNSMTGVYADTAFPDTPVSIQIQQVDNGDVLTQKQQEIDLYVFEQYNKDFEEKGITVTSTGVINGYVEVGITPFNEGNANYLYEIFGKDQVRVVEGIQAVTLGASIDNPEVVMQIESAPEEEPAASKGFFASIWAWFLSIFS